MNTRAHHALAVATVAVLGAASHACSVPECATIDYRRAECRVILENELARMISASGAELRFQDPDAVEADGWVARGLLRERAGDGIVARVAGPGPFALSVSRGPDGPDSVDVRLDNVDPAAVMRVVSAGAEIVVPPPDPPSTSRDLQIPLMADQPTWVRADRPCPDRIRLALTADIQTNPTQFERIVERLQREASEAEQEGEPLLGLLIAGDISEASRDEEMELVLEILERLPFPVAVTAGNHDVFRNTRPYYNYAFGPGNHAFEICGTRIVMLDTGSGALATSVVARLPELFDRQGADHLVVGMHHPVYPGATGGGWSQEDQAALVLSELAIARADLVFAGHVHALHAFEDIPVGDVKLDEIVVGTAGALQGLTDPRFGYVRLTIDADRIDRCFVEVPPPGYDGPTGDPPDELPYCDD